GADREKQQQAAQRVQQKLQTLARDTLEASVALLGDKQQQTWKELTGEPLPAGVTAGDPLFASSVRGPTLFYPGMQEALGITKEQSDKLEEASTQLRTRHKDALEKLERLQQEYAEQSQKFNAKVAQETDAALNKALPDVLEPKQLGRYKQLVIQAKGVDAFLDGEVQKALKLTAEQQETIKS